MLKVWGHTSTIEKVFRGQEECPRLLIILVNETPCKDSMKCEKGDRNMNVILVGSQKNDIGKTIISIRMALELAKSGKNVLMMDLSSGKIKISEYFSVNEVIIYDVVDVLNKTCTIDQGIIEINENLSLLPCPRVPDKIQRINKESFVSLLDDLDYDYLVIDADKFSSSYIDFSKVSNVVSINNNDFSCVKEINSDKVLSSNACNFILVINKYMQKKAKQGTMLKLKDIENLTGTSISAFIEENIMYSDLQYEKLLDDNFLKNEINNIIKKLK